MTEGNTPNENDHDYRGPSRLHCNHVNRESLDREHRFLPSLAQILTLAYGAEGRGWGFEPHTETNPVQPRDGMAPRGTQIPNLGNVVIYPDGDRHAHENDVMSQQLLFLTLGRASISR